MIKIVTDSSSDLINIEGVGFASVPLKIITNDKEFLDDANLNVKNMVEYLSSYKGKSSTSCPSPGDFLSAFQDAEQIFCITITGTLSGSYNSACIAKQMYLEKHPDRKVEVFNSLSVGPEMLLIIEKIKELVNQGIRFEDICNQIKKYMEHTHLLFMLESMKNLANNGRVKPLVAKMAGLLGIRIVGKASSKGDLEILNKCRGTKKALETMVNHIKELGYKGGKVRISHCFNLNAANKLKELICNEFKKADIKIRECIGLCSFYAENGGLLIGFESE